MRDVINKSLSARAQLWPIIFLLDWNKLLLVYKTQHCKLEFRVYYEQIDNLTVVTFAARSLEAVHSNTNLYIRKET